MNIHVLQNWVQDTLGYGLAGVGETFFHLDPRAVNGKILNPRSTKRSQVQHYSDPPKF
jgi:hypothetical protein